MKKEELEKEVERLAEEVKKLNILLAPQYHPIIFISPPELHNPALHYHNGSPCYNNPCVWC